MKSKLILSNLLLTSLMSDFGSIGIMSSVHKPVKKDKMPLNGSEKKALESLTGKDKKAFIKQLKDKYNC